MRDPVAASFFIAIILFPSLSLPPLGFYVPVEANALSAKSSSTYAPEHHFFPPLSSYKTNVARLIG